MDGSISKVRRHQVGLLLVLLAVGGCGARKEPLYPVRGKVIDSTGKPAVGALVIFNRVGDARSDTARPLGRVDGEGTFRLTTYTEGDGAPAGEYPVTILWPTPRKTPFEREGPDQLGGAYADPNNPKVRFTVEKNPDNEVPTIQLKNG
jgi:hypothetical protein